MFKAEIIQSSICIILPPQRLSWLTKKVFWRKLSGHNSSPHVYRWTWINQEGPEISLKINAIVSDFMACVRKNHWVGLPLQRLRCSIDTYGLIPKKLDTTLTKSFCCLTFIQMTWTRERESHNCKQYYQRSENLRMSRASRTAFQAI